MCRESITVGLCAPSAPPALTFTCGRLHMISARRDVCGKALGSCTCFFGTCGAIERVASPKPFELGDIAKVRCAECTPREDQVGERRHGRELADSPLLLRNAVKDPAAIAKFEQDRKALWNDAPACPFHGGSGLQLDSPACSETEKSLVSDSSRSLMRGPGPAQARHRGASHPQSSSSDETSSRNAHKTSDTPESGLSLHMGLVASRWATNSTKSTISDASPAFRVDGRGPRQGHVVSGGIERASKDQASPGRPQDAHSIASTGRSSRKTFLDSAKKFLERA